MKHFVLVYVSYNGDYYRTDDNLAVSSNRDELVELTKDGTFKEFVGCANVPLFLYKVTHPYLPKTCVDNDHYWIQEFINE